MALSIVCVEPSATWGTATIGLDLRGDLVEASTPRMVVAAVIATVMNTSSTVVLVGVANRLASTVIIIVSQGGRGRRACSRTASAVSLALYLVPGESYSVMVPAELFTFD